MCIRDRRLVARMNTEYGEGTVTLELRDQYYNMREKIEPVMHIIDLSLIHICYFEIYTDMAS